LADPPGATSVILDNLGWYCDLVNIFIRQGITWLGTGYAFHKVQTAPNQVT